MWKKMKRHRTKMLRLTALPPEQRGENAQEGIAGKEKPLLNACFKINPLLTHCTCGTTFHCQPPKALDIHSKLGQTSPCRLWSTRKKKCQLPLLQPIKTERGPDQEMEEKPVCFPYLPSPPLRRCNFPLIQSLESHFLFHKQHWNISNAISN